MIVLAVIGAVVVGMWRGSSYLQELSMYQKYFGLTVVIEGVVADDPTHGSRGVALVIKNVEIKHTVHAGAVYVTTADIQDVIRGQKIAIQGKLSEGFGSYGATMYRAKVERISPSSDIGIGIREWFADRVRQVVGEPASDLGMGFLTGQKSTLPVDLSDALQVAGLTHVVVASGYNLTILVRFARRFFMRISKFFSGFGSVGLVLGFVAVAGLGPSLERAAIVTLLSLAAWYYGRRFHPLVLLALVASITVCITPSFVWNDLGWALSFLAFFGVMIIAPVLQKFFFGDKKPRAIRQILGETISAHVMTAPLLVGTFGLLSHVAVFANLLVLPLVPLAMLLTFLAGITASLPLIGDSLGMLTEWLLGYMISTVHFFASLPWAQSEVEISNWIIVGVYAAIVGAVILLVRKTKHDIKDSNIIE